MIAAQTPPMALHDAASAPPAPELCPPEEPQAPAKPGEDPILTKALDVATRGVSPGAVQQPAASATVDQNGSPNTPRIPPNVMQPDTPSRVPAAPQH